MQLRLCEGVSLVARGGGKGWEARGHARRAGVGSIMARGLADQEERKKVKHPSPSSSLVTAFQLRRAEAGKTKSHATGAAISQTHRCGNMAVVHPARVWSAVLARARGKGGEEKSLARDHREANRLVLDMLPSWA